MSRKARRGLTSSNNAAFVGEAPATVDEDELDPEVVVA
jgi:hypothetical protein